MTDPGFKPANGQRDIEVMKGLIRRRANVSLLGGLIPGYATPGLALKS